MVDGTLAASSANAARCPAPVTSVCVLSSEVVLMTVIGVLEAVPTPGGSRTNGTGTASGGMGAGMPNGGRKGTTGYGGSGTLQSALKKLSGGRANGDTVRRGGGGAGVIGGGTLNMPGGKMGTGRAGVLPTGGGRGTARGWRYPCRSDGR